MGSRESGTRVGPAWDPRRTRVGPACLRVEFLVLQLKSQGRVGPAWDPKGPAWDPRGTRVGPAGLRVPKPTCLLCLCFARPHYRIPFGDHPIKLERYRED